MLGADVDDFGYARGTGVQKCIMSAAMSARTLGNSTGDRVVLSTLGAAITSISLANADGTGFEATVQAGGSAGKTIGRYANRIAGGRFELDGRVYRLLTNQNGNTLHGGPDGFSKREWQIEGDEFVLYSPDGDQGFPGALECRVRYTYSDERALRIDFTATTDKPTILNLTNHVYFNLGGEIAQHRLRIDADACTPVNDRNIPTGEIASVEGTARDFRLPRALGTEPIDLNYVLNGWNGELREVAELYSPASGRRLFVETTQPGLQLFTGKPGAVALEAQHFADAPHHPQFTSTVLRPGEVFRATTVYRFA